MQEKISNYIFSIVLFTFLLNTVINGIEITETSENCPLQLSKICRCGNAVYNEINSGKDVYVVNCSYVNLSNITFLHYLPQETEVLLLNNNNISELTNEFLVEPQNYKKLKVIDLSYNNLSSIHNETFRNLTELQILNLNDNHLQITGDNFYSKLFYGLDNLENLQLKNAFGEKYIDINFMEVLNTILKESKLNNLKILNLAENHIRLFNSPFTFCSLPSLEKLYLDHNQLADNIELNLKCTPKLFILNLSYNFITKLTNSTIENYDDSNLLFHLNLTNNPFNCDCELIPFISWLQRTKVWVVESKLMQCERGYPELNVGRYLNNLTLNDLHCKDNLTKDEQTAFQQHLVITYSIVISLVASLLILLTAILLVTRKSIVFYWQEFFSSITKKRDYAPLEKHNNQTIVNQQPDNLEDQFEEAQQKQQNSQLPATEIDEDVV